MMMFARLKEPRAIIIFFVFLLYPFFPLIKEWTPSMGLLLESLLLVLLFIIAFLKHYNGKVIVNYNLNVVLLISLLVAYFFVNISDAYIAFSGLRVFLLYIFLLLAIVQHEKCRYLIHIAVKANIVSSSIMSFGCILQFVYPTIIQSFHNPIALPQLRMKTSWASFDIFNRALSFMNDPNVLGVYLAFSVILLYFVYSINKEKKISILLFIHIVAMLLTQSRTSIFLLLIFTFAIIFSPLIQSKKINLTAAAIICVASIVTCALVYQYWESIMFFLRADTIMNGNGRFEKNNIHLDSFFSDGFHFFLGNGMFDGRQIIFENSYLAIIHIFGVLGSFLFIPLFFSTFKVLFSKKNLEILICSFSSYFVGDYILIPQISLVIMLCLMNRNSSCIGNIQYRKGCV